MRHRIGRARQLIWTRKDHHAGHYVRGSVGERCLLWDHVIENNANVYAYTPKKVRWWHRQYSFSFNYQLPRVLHCSAPLSVSLPCFFPSLACFSRVLYLPGSLFRMRALSPISFNPSVFRFQSQFLINSHNLSISYSSALFPGLFPLSLSPIFTLLLSLSLSFSFVHSLSFSFCLSLHCFLPCSLPVFFLCSHPLARNLVARPNEWGHQWTHNSRLLF